MPPLMFLPGFGFVWRLIMFDAFDDQAGSSRAHLQHAAALAAVLAGDDEHVVVLPNGCS